MINRLQSQIFGQFSRLTGICMMVLVSVAGSPVWAQVEELKPPKASESPSSPKFLIMGIALLLLGATVVVVTLKTKRDHQD